MSKATLYLRYAVLVAIALPAIAEYLLRKMFLTGTSRLLFGAGLPPYVAIVLAFVIALPMFYFRVRDAKKSVWMAGGAALIAEPFAALASLYAATNTTVNAHNFLYPFILIAVLAYLCFELPALMHKSSVPTKN